MVEVKATGHEEAKAAMGTQHQRRGGGREKCVRLLEVPLRMLQLA